MSLLNEKDAIIFIIDIQEKLINATFNKDTLEKKSIIMANTARILELPVVVTEQYPKGLGGTISNIKESLNNDESKYFEKTSFSALDCPEVFEALASTNRKQVVILGIETHICVNQTVYSLINRGYDVYVVADACGSRCETEHIAGLERMKEHGAHIITTEIALFELLRGAKHPKFKEVQGLIK